MNREWVLDDDAADFSSELEKEEIRELTQSIKLALCFNPNAVALLYVKKGICLYVIRNYLEAMECFDKAIAIDDSIAEAFYQKGVVSRQLNDSLAAADCFNKATTINPEFIEAYNSKG